MPNMKLIISIINYLKEQAKKEADNPDTQESLEVAVQCLQTAYDLDSSDLLSPEPLSLEDIFSKAVPPSEVGIDSNDLNKAELMKNMGNDLMKNNQFQDAVKHYSAAIDIDKNNAVYYCNRAAAYSKLEDFKNAIKDCEKAVQIDPLYAKAYGRMGSAHISMEQPDLAIKAFNKALEIEPENESYQTNLQIAKVQKSRIPPNPGPGLAGLNNVDWQSLFSNPAFRNMASSIMQDPNIMGMLSSGLNSTFGAAASRSFAPGTDESPQANPSNPSGGNLDAFLEAGQFLAAQMQAANPDLVQQARQRDNTNPENKDSNQ